MFLGLKLTLVEQKVQIIGISGCRCLLDEGSHMRVFTLSGTDIQLTTDNGFLLDLR